jgi:type III restriction enzyme
VFDWTAGWETGKTNEDGSPLVAAGKLALFTNEDHGRWRDRPNSILVDSTQLESGEAMSAEFKAVAAAEIDEFKREYRARFPGRNVEDLTDEDLLREVMNTVGKAGKLGEQIRCVVSVSMLTEGWDANTVTHILGVRAFGTQLLCEQVVGRGLRRMSYAVNDQDRFDPEYAEIYGVPFSFIPTAGASEIVSIAKSTRVRALEERARLELTFPRVAGYRYDFGTERLQAEFSTGSKLALSTADVPTWTEAAPIVGESSVHTLDDLKQRRQSEVAFALAKLTLEKYFRADDGDADVPGTPRQASHVKSWLFPQLLGIAKRWLAECLVCKDDTFPQLLLLVEPAHDAVDRIYRSIVATTQGAATLVPILRPFDVEGSTRWVDFDTAKPVFETSPGKCHVSHVVADTGSWEQKLAQTLESMPEVEAYVKNQGLNFTIPYTLNGDERQYHPDFVVRLAGGLNVIVEVSGEERKDKAAKVATARTLWVPAINNHGGFGRWAFIEVTDPWDAKNTIRAALAETGVSA